MIVVPTLAVAEETDNQIVATGFIGLVVRYPHRCISELTDQVMCQTRTVRTRAVAARLRALSENAKSGNGILLARARLQLRMQILAQLGAGALSSIALSPSCIRSR